MGKGKSNTKGGDTPQLKREGSSFDRLTRDDSRKFWTEYFNGDEEVSWQLFAAALSREFAFAKSDIDSIETVQFKRVLKQMLLVCLLQGVVQCI